MIQPIDKPQDLVAPRKRLYTCVHTATYWPLLSRNSKTVPWISKSTVQMNRYISFKSAISWRILARVVKETSVIDKSRVNLVCCVKRSLSPCPTAAWMTFTQTSNDHFSKLQHNLKRRRPPSSSQCTIWWNSHEQGIFENIVHQLTTRRFSSPYE
jgi:hypothetical protein